LSAPRDDTRVRRRGRVDPTLDAALASVGIAVVDDVDATLVHVLPHIDDLPDLSPVLVAWAADARSALGAGATVLTVIDAHGFDTDEVPAAMLAHGVVAATRSLAMEGARDGVRANLLVLDSNVDPSEVATTLLWLESASSVTAEVVHLGAVRHGKQPV
jgi:NAD(P)-dependent dehydrogenase (short-subunit alcohol dehydrogenase family)